MLVVDLRCRYSPLINVDLLDYRVVIVYFCFDDFKRAN